MSLIKQVFLFVSSQRLSDSNRKKRRWPSPSAATEAAQDPRAGPGRAGSQEGRPRRLLPGPAPLLCRAVLLSELAGLPGNLPLFLAGNTDSRETALGHLEQNRGP